MDAAARKAAVRACRENKAVAGIYALRCGNGQVWVGQSRNLAAQQNHIRFALLNGGFLSASLREALAGCGPEGFAYEELERLEEPEEGVPVYVRTRWLIDRERHWRNSLSAGTL